MSPLLILLFGVAPATAIGTDFWFAALTTPLGSVPASLLVGLWLYWRGGGPHTDAVQGLLLGLVLIATAVVTLFRQSIARRTLALSIVNYRHFASIEKIAGVTGGAVLGTLVTLSLSVPERWA